MTTVSGRVGFHGSVPVQLSEALMRPAGRAGWAIRTRAVGGGSSSTPGLLLGLRRRGVGLRLDEACDVDPELVLEHLDHRAHAAADGAHHLADAPRASRAVPHLDDVDLVDARELRREGLCELGHLLDDHVEDGGLVELFPGLPLPLKSFCFREELLLNDLGLLLSYP